MKRSTFTRASLILAAFAGSVAAPLIAALFEQSDISTGARGRMVLEKKQADNSLARIDRILIINGSDTTEVFNSEGRAIEQVLEEDLDLDGNKELLLQMDLGGSGGFKEFALLRYQNGKFEPIWEETGYKAGEASIEDPDGDGRPNLFIKYGNTEVKPPKEETDEFTLENGELKKVE